MGYENKIPAWSHIGKPLPYIDTIKINFFKPMEEPKMKHSDPLPPCGVQKYEQIEINSLKICSTECCCLVIHIGNFWV